MSALVSASGLGRALACPYSLRPELERLGSTSAAAQYGTDVHEQIQRLVDGSPVGAPLPEVEQWSQWWWAGRHDNADGCYSELTLAYDLDSGKGRYLPSAAHRDYSSAGPSEVVGTADLVMLDGPRVEIYDWKTGRQEGTEPAATNTQLAFLALAAVASFGGRRARVHLVFLDGSDEPPHVDSAELSTAQLDALRARLLDTHAAQIFDALPEEPTPGKHCRYCRSKHVCLATTRAVEAVAEAAPIASETARLVFDSADFESREQAAKQYALIRRARDEITRRLDAAEDACKDFVRAAGGALELGGGRLLACKTTCSKRIVLNQAGYAVINEELGPAAPAAIQLKTSQEDMRKAISALRVGRRGLEPIKAILERVMARLQDVGAVISCVGERWVEWDKISHDFDANEIDLLRRSG